MRGRGASRVKALVALAVVLCFAALTHRSGLNLNVLWIGLFILVGIAAFDPARFN